MSDISLEIHHLDVRGGDATAIIVKEHIGVTEKDLYRVLIDAGAEGSGSNALKFYLETYLPGAFDLVVATHYHQDHIQGFSKANISFREFVDIGGHKDGDGRVFVPRNDIGKGARSTVFESYVARTQQQQDPNNKRLKLNPKRKAIDFIDKNSTNRPVPLEIPLDKERGIKLICYCANGILANGHNVLENEQTSAINPNDVSIALILQWDDFLYFTAGDLSGSTRPGSYFNIETPLVKYLSEGPLRGKRITVLKASHHGSEHSTQDYLLNTLQPDTIVVCCNMHKQVPSPVFLDRLKTYFAGHRSSRVVFTNTMKMFKADDRYNPLKHLEDAKATLPGNLQFSSVGEKDEFASNLNVKCVVIRRRKENGKWKEPDKLERACGQLYVDPPGYDISLLKRDERDAQQVAATVRFRDFKWNLTWRYVYCDEDIIFRQFAEQATRMHEWLARDDKEKKNKRRSKSAEEDLGRAHMSENYPALLPVAERATDDERKDALTSKMKEMFCATFRLNRDEQPWQYEPKENNLSSDEKKTLFLLLYQNVHQITLNMALSKFQFKLRDAWNVPGGPDAEPYPPAPWVGIAGSKRQLDQAPDDLETKKARKDQ